MTLQNHVDTVHECDRQTDRQTDGQTDGQNYDHKDRAERRTVKSPSIGQMINKDFQCPH